MQKYSYFYGGAELENSYLTIADDYGIITNGSIAIRHISSGSYQGLNVGIQSDSEDLHLWGHRVRIYTTLRIESGSYMAINCFGLMSLHDALVIDDLPSGKLAIKAHGQVNVERSSSSDSSIWVEKGGIYVKDGFITLNGGPVTTSSDRRVKNAISPLSEKYISLIKSIKPVSYKFNNISHSDRKHTGFIAQDVLQAMTAAGIDTTEFAAFVDLHGDGTEYGLRYEEFISPLLAYVQHLEGRIAALERTG
jgi:hypothetical protein